MTDIRTPKPKDITVAIIDDHEVVLEGFRSYLVRNGISHVDIFSRNQDLLDILSVHLFDFYIVSINLPDIDNMELINQIRAIHPKAHIIINTIHEKMWMMKKLTEKQIEGVICKTARLKQLLEAIKTISKGQQYLCQEYKQSQAIIQNEILTKREVEVLNEIAKGKSSKEIATSLFISENTVENHRKSIFRKLKACNMANLIVKSIAAGYINQETMFWTTVAP